MRNLFGTGSPQIIWHKGQEDEIKLKLEFVVITKDLPEADIINRRSPITGYRAVKFLGKHHSFEVKMFLYQYDRYPGYGFSSREIYELLKPLEGEDVVLYRHHDGEPFKDSDGNEIMFFIESIDEAYLETTDFKDLLLIKFKSKNYVKLSNSLKQTGYGNSFGKSYGSTGF